MGKAAVQVLINCNFMNFIVIDAVHLLVFVFLKQYKMTICVSQFATPDVSSHCDPMWSQM